MRKPKAYVLDSWAVMAFLQDEPAAERIADLLADAQENGIPLGMTVVNAGEIWYIVARRTSTAEADRTLRLIEEIGVRLFDADLALTKVAAGYKVKGNISYADCYAAALAKQQKAHLVTGDEEFKPLESEISILWL
jgi:predicted nucleic acid-binding protein